MKKVYLISGLGADRTVFSKLDLSFCEPVFLDWIKPLKNDTLRSYALRLSEKITEPDATIIGLSMGGMMASEIVKANPAMKAIIISSNRTSKEFPPYTRFLIKYLPLYRLTTKAIMRLIFPINCWVMGAETAADKQRLRDVIERTDLPFVKWCINSIGHWDLTEPQPNIIHIHGDKDNLLRYQYVHADYTIKGGGHLMIMNKANELSVLLRKLIEQ